MLMVHNGGDDGDRTALPRGLSQATAGDVSGFKGGVSVKKSECARARSVFLSPF